MDLVIGIQNNKNSCRTVHREPDMQEFSVIGFQELYRGIHTRELPDTDLLAERIGITGKSFLVILGAGAFRILLLIELVGMLLHIFRGFQEISVIRDRIVIALSNERIVPGDIHVIPFITDPDHIPGMRLAAC